MPNTFSLKELNDYDAGFKQPAPVAPVAPVVEEPPPVALDPETPVESPPAEDPVGDVVDDADPTPAAADEPAPVAPRKGASERIQELIDERNALKKFIDYRESTWNAPPKTDPPPAATPVAAKAAEGAPTLESCQFDTDKWTQAMNAWTQKQIQTGIRQALDQDKQTQTQAQSKEKFEERMQAAEKAIPDFKTVLGNPALPQLHPDAALLVVNSDVGPQILYHLGKNPEKAARIARKSPLEQAAAIGQIMGELKVPKPQKQLSSAPPPPSPNRGGSAPPLEDTKMPLKDFMAKEKAALAARRKRH